MRIITTLHDPSGIYMNLIEKEVEQLKPLCDNLYIAHTADTNKKVLQKMKQLGAKLTVAGLYGESRIESIKLALNKNDDYYFDICFDKLLHWLAIDNADCNHLLKHKYTDDFIIVSRTKNAYRTYPESWIQTEAIINRLFSEKTGLKSDPYACVNIFNNKAANLLIKFSKEKEWGSAVEFPLIAYTNKLSMSSLWTDNLSWEDPDRFNENAFELYGGFENWKKAKYDRFKEWQHRTSSMLEQLRVLNDYFPDTGEHRY